MAKIAFLILLACLQTCALPAGESRRAECRQLPGFVLTVDVRDEGEMETSADYQGTLSLCKETGNGLVKVCSASIHAGDGDPWIFGRPWFAGYAFVEQGYQIGENEWAAAVVVTEGDYGSNKFDHCCKRLKLFRIAGQKLIKIFDEPILESFRNIVCTEECLITAIEDQSQGTLSVMQTATSGFYDLHFPIEKQTLSRPYKTYWEGCGERRESETPFYRHDKEERVYVWDGNRYVRKGASLNN